jgi:hypothetical protein
MIRRHKVGGGKQESKAKKQAVKEVVGTIGGKGRTKGLKKCVRRRVVYVVDMTR